VGPAFSVLFSLYVGVAVLIPPQDCLKRRLLLEFATFFIVCFGVAHEFSATSQHSTHVEFAAVWVWRNAEFIKRFYKKSITRKQTANPNPFFL
jgi:hypothetical protein